MSFYYLTDLPEEGNDELEGDDGAKGLQPGAPGFGKFLKALQVIVQSSHSYAAKRETVHHQHAARAKEGDSNMAVVTGANGLGTMKEVVSNGSILILMAADLIVHVRRPGLLARMTR